jgi:Uma2 family endonuclease
MEPELHLHDDIIVPDVAGWRIERMPRLPKQAYFTTTPDWVCEVHSPKTRRLDRSRKRVIYAKNGVGHLWFIDPRDRSFETYKLLREHWLLVGDAGDDERVRVEPFEAIELELGLLWDTAAPAANDPAPVP